MEFRILDNRGSCILHIYLTTHGEISQAAPGVHWWAEYILHETYYLSIKVAQGETLTPPWKEGFRLAEFMQQGHMLENWALLNVILSSYDDCIVEEISAMYFYCSREEFICLKNVRLTTPHDELFRQMFPLSWPAGSFDYKQWPMYYHTLDEWILKGESKIDQHLNPPPFRSLSPKNVHTSHIFENRLLSNLLLHFNSSLQVSWDFPEFVDRTVIRIENQKIYLGGYFVFHAIPQIGFVYCNNKTSPHHYINSIASPLDWPTWACAAGTYVAMSITIRMISGQWQLLHLFISLLAQGATVSLQRFRAVWLLWIITAMLCGWFFTSSIEALLVSPTLPTGINDMEGLFNNDYTLVMDEWSGEGKLASWDPEFMSETGYLQGLKASKVLSHTWMNYDETFLKDGLTKPKRALALESELADVLLSELREQLERKQCFGNPNALSMYPEGMMAQAVNGRMVTDAAIRLRTRGLDVWYQKNAAVYYSYEWMLRLRNSLKVALPDQVKDKGLANEWNAKDTLLEGFHRTTDGNELRALLAICSIALAVAFAVFLIEVHHCKIVLVSAKLSTLLKSVWRWAFSLYTVTLSVVYGYFTLAAYKVIRFLWHRCTD